MEKKEVEIKIMNDYAPKCCNRNVKPFGIAAHNLVKCTVCGTLYEARRDMNGDGSIVFKEVPFVKKR